MNKKIIYLIIFAGLFGLAVFVSAQSITNPLGVSTFPALIEKIAGAVRDIVASLAVLMLIIAGIYFLLSAGSPNMLSKAKAALMYAIIGGAIGLAAQGLVTLLKTIIGA